MYWSSRVALFLLQVAQALLERMSWGEYPHHFHAVILHHVIQRDPSLHPELAQQLQDDADYQYRLFRLRRLFSPIKTMAKAAALLGLILSAPFAYRMMPEAPRWPTESSSFDISLPPLDPYLQWLSSLSPVYSVAWLRHHSPVVSVSVPPHIMNIHDIQPPWEFYSSLDDINCAFIKAAHLVARQATDSLERTSSVSLIDRWRRRLGLPSHGDDELRAEILRLVERAVHTLSEFFSHRHEILLGFIQAQESLQQYEQRLQDALNSIATRIAYRHGPERGESCGPSEAECMEQWAPAIKRLFAFKSWTEFQSLNIFVALQRFEAMSFFAQVAAADLQSVRLLGKNLHVHTLTSALQYLQSILRPVSTKHETHLHQLGYMAGLYAAKHWTHYHGNKKNTKNSPDNNQNTPAFHIGVDSAGSWDFHDTATCLANFRNALKIAREARFPPSSLGMPRRPMTCIDYLRVTRIHGWLDTYFSSLAIAESPILAPNPHGPFADQFWYSSPNSRHTIFYPEPAEPEKGTDWNCRSWRDNKEIRGGGGSAMPLSGRGLRRGNVGDGKKVEWWQFRRVANGERCLMFSRTFELGSKGGKVWDFWERLMDGNKVEDEEVDKGQEAEDILDKVRSGMAAHGVGERIWCLRLPWEEEGGSEEMEMSGGNGKDGDNVWAYFREPKDTRNRRNKGGVAGGRELNPEDRFLVEAWIRAKEEVKRRGFEDESWKI
ncbi:hypothetical protein AC578_9870 [Pseudocercospora eumusae]|uniref:Uncharacterized protein n=1 Tax=Pseudocercospora eumusae TaxID=321146 RepID=A0A139HB09_9PEZI|nr:hypothetical protein AC578_9870 [Pseudocercospora eumusae]